MIFAGEIASSAHLQLHRQHSNVMDFGLGNPPYGGVSKVDLIQPPCSPVMAGLIEAALEGGFETPLWDSFLARLRQATGADYALLAFQAPGMVAEEAVLCFSGPAPPDAIRQVLNERVYPLARSQRPPSPPQGLPFALADLHLYGERMSRDLALPYRLTAIRGLRITEETGVDGSLMICGRGPDFTVQDDALLEAVAPVLRGALRSYVALERERFAGSVAADAMRCLQFGWIALDAGGVILETDPTAQAMLVEAKVLHRRPNGELGLRDAAREREVRAAVRALAEQPQSRARAIPLCRDPWLDMLLTPAQRKAASVKLQPAVLAFVHGDSWSSADRVEQLAELFGLTPGEARLALALSGGMTIAEAAHDFGISVKTARGYTKIIYAKTGARGLPDLIRMVMRSVLAVTPES